MADNKTIDWHEIRRRLEAARTSIEQGWILSRGDREKVLKERARALANEPKKEDERRETIEIIEFMLAYEKYGIETSYVREAYPLKDLTQVPCTPPFVLGIINVRGEILSVIDIKKFFDLPEKGLGDLNKIIILNNEKMEFGILADVILGVRNILSSELQQSIPTLTGIREEYLKGVTKERVVILDAKKLLSDKTIIVHEDVQI